MVLGLAGCAAKVKQDDFNNEMAKLRQEMQAGDQAVASRVDSTNEGSPSRPPGSTRWSRSSRRSASEYTVSIEKVRGMLKFNVPVHFEFASSELREADRPVLDRFASVVAEYYPGALVTVEGFTDPAGSAAYNLHLGKQRAEAVKGVSRRSGRLRAGPRQGGELRRGPQPAGDARRARPGRGRGRRTGGWSLVIDHAAVATDQLSIAP